MTDFDRIRTVKEAAQARLLRIPGVHSVGIGPKLKGGNKTGELSIVVWVTRKLPANGVPAAQLIPAEIEGIKTDVVEQPEPVIHRSGDSSHPAKEDGSTFDPLVGGCRIQRKFEDASGNLVVESGTLGCLATTKGALSGIPAGMVVGVTCHHVLYGCTPDAGIGAKVGQPTATDSCSKCCSDIIGQAMVGRLVLDCALVELTPKLNYMAEVYDIGPIAGTHEVLNSEIPVSGPDVYAVRKHGFRTGTTAGQIVSVNHSGSINDGNGNVCHSYTNALAIIGLTPQDVPFGTQGDSGSAIICDQGADKGKVVGIFFGGAQLYALATNIQDIMTALSIDVLTATQAGVVLPVPTIAGAPAFARAALAGDPLLAPTSDDRVVQVLAQAQADVIETAVGKDYLESFQLHQQELFNLISKNRRVAAVWRANGGPSIVGAFLRVIQLRDQVFPAEIDGRPLEECITKIQRVLVRYATHTLSADIGRLAARVGKCAGLTYPQILSTLQTAHGD